MVCSLIYYFITQNTIPGLNYNPLEKGCSTGARNFDENDANPGKN